MSIKRSDLAKMSLDDIGPVSTLTNVSSGTVLIEEFMQPLGLSARALARDIGVPANRITGIINGQRMVTAETAILLGERFGTTAEFWMKLQAAYDLEEARKRLGRPLQSRSTAVPP
ncbi:MAG: HigA family addiction module antitoxin [Janthinobacterium lividum]